MNDEAQQTLDYSSKDFRRHPKHLRGKAIGLWYSEQQRQKRSIRSSKSHQMRPSSVVTKIELTPFESEDFTRLTPIETNRRVKQRSTKFEVDQSVEFDEESSIVSDEHSMPFERLHSSFQCFDRLEEKSEVDQFLLEDLTMKQSSATYRQFEDNRKKLPIATFREQILKLMEENQIFVLVGDTGSGKTTQTVQFILDDKIKRKQGSQCRIICSQPRRISATSIAERVAQERGEQKLGESVGYHIRLSAEFPRKFGSILFCTTGMMLKYIEQFERFEHFSHIILDEVHERSIEMDFLLIFIRRLLKERSDVKVILMSASIQAEKFSDYFGRCPILNIPGSLYPIDQYYLEDFITMLEYPHQQNRFQRRMFYKTTDESNKEDFRKYLDELQFDLASQQKPIEVWRKIQEIGTDFHPEINCHLVVSVIDFICRTTRSGTILVFLGGWTDISKCMKLLREEQSLFRFIRVLPLHSLLTLKDQKEIFKPVTDKNLRKVILSTSIAESSITVEDVVYVIDAGRTKGSDYNIQTQGKSLLPIKVSKANLIQRKGRAGRTRPGFCYRLFTRCHEKLFFSDFPQAEMTTTRLDSIYLQAKLIKVSNVEQFLGEAIDPPNSESIKHAENFLFDLGALNNDRTRLTATGTILAHLPMSPQIGKLLLIAYLFSCFDPILTITSFLSYRDPFVFDLEKNGETDFIRYQFSNKSMSDHLTFVNIYNQWRKQRNFNQKQNFCYENFLNLTHMNMIDKIRFQLQGLVENYFGSLTDRANRNSRNEDLICALMCAGLYPNVARLQLSTNKRSKRICKFESKWEKNLSIHLKSVNAKLKVEDIQRSSIQSIFLVFYEKIQTSSTFIHDTTFVSSYTVLFFGKSKLAPTQSISLTSNDDQNSIKVLVDEWIEINISRSDYALIESLKQKFNDFLEAKSLMKNILFPNENQLIDSIVRFITKKDKFHLNEVKSTNNYSRETNFIDQD